MALEFNEESEKAQYIYKRNPLVEHAFQIFEFKDKKNDYEPVGDYTLLDTDEDTDLTEKKLVNLVALLNGKQDIMDLANLTNTRLLYNIVPKTSQTDKTKVIFRTYNNEGVSKENAVLILEKGVINDGSNEKSAS